MTPAEITPFCSTSSSCFRPQSRHRQPVGSSAPPFPAAAAYQYAEAGRVAERFLRGPEEQKELDQRAHCRCFGRPMRQNETFRLVVSIGWFKETRRCVCSIQVPFPGKESPADPPGLCMRLAGEDPAGCLCRRCGRKQLLLVLQNGVNSAGVRRRP